MSSDQPVPLKAHVLCFVTRLQEERTISSWSLYIYYSFNFLAWPWWFPSHHQTALQFVALHLKLIFIFTREVPFASWNEPQGDYSDPFNLIHSSLARPAGWSAGPPRWDKDTNRRRTRDLIQSGRGHDPLGGQLYSLVWLCLGSKIYVHSCAQREALRATVLIF